MGADVSVGTVVGLINRLGQIQVGKIFPIYGLGIEVAGSRFFH